MSSTRSSKLAALEWAEQDVALPGEDRLGADPQIFYRAMDFLREADEAIQREVFFVVANLFNLEVDVLLFDTTSSYFETEDADDFRRYGHSKGHRPDRPQTVIGMALTKAGIPVRCWSFPGNASDQGIDSLDALARGGPLLAGGGSPRGQGGVGRGAPLCGLPQPAGGGAGSGPP